jgi:hypothetical protein
VRVVKQIGRHRVTFGGEAHSGWLPRGAAEPKRTLTKTVEVNLVILDDGAGYLLEWVGPTAEYSGDTWHETVEEAVAHAESALGVPPQLWSDEE